MSAAARGGGVVGKYDSVWGVEDRVENICIEGWRCCCRYARWNRVGAMQAPMLGVSSQLVVVVVFGAVATMGEGGADA